MGLGSIPFGWNVLCGCEGSMKQRRQECVHILFIYYGLENLADSWCQMDVTRLDLISVLERGKDILKPLQLRLLYICASPCERFSLAVPDKD